MANTMLRPCGLGCQLLGPRYSACLGHKPHPQPPASMRPHHAQSFAHTGQVRMTAQNPPATNGDLGREQGTPESTRTM